MPAFLNDLRFAFRMFARNPGATAVAVVSLALAIGPNSALFSVVDRLMLKPPPVLGISQIYRFSARTDQEGQWEFPSYPDLLDYQAQAGDTAEFIAVERRAAMLNVKGRQEVVPINFVTENYFPLLGAHAAAGRMLLESDARFEGAPPAVISYSLWQRSFGGAADLVGKTILLNHSAFYVAGIAPRGFRGPVLQILPVDVWIPFSAASSWSKGAKETLMRRGIRSIEVQVRLRDGVDKSRAEAALTTVATRLAQQYPATNRGKTVHLIPAEGQAVLGLMVLSLVGLVVLIACANIAGILLAQGEARRREFAVRLAMGARRGRLVRQLIAESLLLSLLAAGLGLLLASWLIGALPSVQLAMPIPLAVDYDIRLDGRVVAYTLLLAIGTALAAGLVPALRLSRPDLVPALKGDAPASRSRFRFRGTLVVAQIALSQFLLAGAGLLVRSYLELQQSRPGFNPEGHVLLATLAPAVENPRVDFRQLLETLRAAPGVRHVTFTSSLPLSGSGGGAQRMSAPGITEDPLDVGTNRVGPDYFAVMGTRVLRGRDFQEREPRAAAAVNEMMARRVWGGVDTAVGRFLRVGTADYEVVAVVENGKYDFVLETPEPHVFLGAPGGDATLLIETAGEPGAMAGTVRKALAAAAAPDLTVAGLITLRQQMGLALFVPRIAAGLVGTIAILGIFLAGVGLFGLVSYSVNRRAHEIGVRMAMGARPRDVLALVLRQSLWLVATGAAIGLAAVLLAARLVSVLLYRVSPADPLGLLASVLVVAAVAVLAAQVPARRAVRVDPMMVLRRE